MCTRSIKCSEITRVHGVTIVLGSEITRVLDVMIVRGSESPRVHGVNIVRVPYILKSAYYRGSHMVVGFQVQSLP